MSQSKFQKLIKNVNVNHFMANSFYDEIKCLFALQNVLNNFKVQISERKLLLKKQLQTESQEQASG
ncbi:unnamed protein product [Paramecium pentaurelia]|uniref:Uncharacterized protein n=1 Tax=Paramecium pentaurelia TaxID=43138 RepID=A0A8S1YN16_9CILI|nr:unnamed protein product [Paramecium pentaurelia]